ncbi:hypothetical protein DFA_08134 [Cavenderia fasciculata]|uniref:DUF4286 family protein n=1 Tax=Cavenderia fasciculata TaxID=261658 RepID=F4Q593_CACFS|nr:uncharacterized protein DFA_08134 [Cavenderia fasciculata]EGG17152.1 hypothetical protein DFA_08134 [Cavenderia fasciculata]|eukprot:XP_004355636.1 hypothetical protein DFA_08134 [Cavenderia fasciculata]
MPNIYIYEVECLVPSEVVGKWDEWIPKHIQQILNLEQGLFIKATFNKVTQNIEGLPADHSQYVIQYHTDSQEKIDRYIKEHAPKLKQGTTDVFGDKLKTKRKIYKVDQEFFPQSGQFGYVF